MSETKKCVVKLLDDHGVEHSAEVRAESVYEAALLGLKRLERVGWESNGDTIATVTVEVWEEPTRHLVNVPRLLRWVKEGGDYRQEARKRKLRGLIGT